MNDVVDNTEAESDGGEFDLAGKYEIYTNIGDPEVRGLYDKYQRGKLNVQPDFQRQFVWDNAKCSQLIESALLDIPLPAVYLSEEADGTQSVIDGQQRLTAFFSFIEGKFPGDKGKEFKLSSLKVFKDCNGLMYRELSEKYQDKIKDCKVRSIVFTAKSDSDLKFEIFERLNSGSVKLNDQELRNCIYRGPYNKLLRELSENDKYTKIMGYAEPHKRMIDIEYVLRFAAFYHMTYLNYSSPIKKFLNTEMEERREISDQKAQDLRVAFKNAIDLVYSVFGKSAFRKFSIGDESAPGGAWESKSFNAALYDILMWSLAGNDRNLIMANADAIREALLALMTSNEKFIESIGRGTSSTKMVKIRFDIWNRVLNDILDTKVKQPRCFSRALKEEFFKKDPTCAICGNHITEIDDAAMDHVEQYWLGGKTVPDNARLTHRYCNNARSKNDKKPN